MTISATRIEYHGWSNMWRIANRHVELLVTADVGPRILHFGFAGGENEFYEAAGQLGLCGGDQFNIFGGHRLWVSPETDRTTLPDNAPVQVTQAAESMQFTAPADASGLQKELRIKLDTLSARLTVVHRIYNRGVDPTLAAPWALSVLRPGGRAVVPLPARAPWGPKTLLPTSSLALWSYTDLSLPCWRPGSRYLQLNQALVPSNGFGMQKIGLRNRGAWGAYYRNGHLFVKQSPAPVPADEGFADEPRQHGRFPDFGSNLEIYADERFIEIETIGPEVLLHPGEHVEHIEQWMLFGEVDEGDDDGWAEREVLPRASQLSEPAGHRS